MATAGFKREKQGQGEDEILEVFVIVLLFNVVKSLFLNFST